MRLESQRVDGYDTAERFKSQLAREMLASQRLRVSILAGLFGVATTFLILVSIYTYMWGAPPNVWSSTFIWRAPPNAWLPLFVPVLTLGVVIFELSMRRFVGRCIRRSSSVPAWIWLVGSFLEVSMMTIMIFLARDTFENPIYSLSVPPVLGYTLLIVLSTLHLDPRLCLFTGVVAASEFLALALCTLATYGAESGLGPLLTSPFFYGAKALLLFLAGAGAALVARELSRRLINSFVAMSERDHEQQANAFKTRFLANMSHEIRTPLNAILGYTQLLAMDDKLTPAQRQTLRTITASGDHLVGVINDVLDLSKIEAGRDELHASSFQLDILIRDLAAMFELSCSRKNIAWNLVADIPPGPVYGDETKLCQVLTNLLGNAVKFTDSGRVTFRITKSSPSHYTFAIEDSGPGIAKEHQALIFEPFHQEADGQVAGGTGLGLAIAHRYVSLIGGRLTVTSEPGYGARFFFTVPLPPVDSISSDVEDAAWESIVGLAPGYSVDALVVDDVVQNRDVLAQVLTRLGVQVRQAENGKQALAQIAQQVPDIVFLDIRMPGLSGLETMQRAIEAVGADKLKFVAVSASALAHERSMYLQSGFDEFLEKPLHLQKLYAALSQLLGIRYRYGVAPASQNPENLDWGKIVLPEALYNSLVRAMQSHNITELHRHIDEMASLGERERNLADHLRDINRRYDMAALLDVLDGIAHE